jgi:hypothetical protein
MKTLKEISAFFTSVHGIIICIISVITLSGTIIGLISASRLKHDAAIKEATVKEMTQASSQAKKNARIEKWIELDSVQNIGLTRFFLSYDSSKKEAITVSNRLVKGLIVLDSAMERHLRLTNRTEERYKLLKDQLDEKKNWNSLWIQSGTFE